ncbi:mitochondrial import inner membrane translocase subunit TIM50, putative [Plasmodium chabaudi adami]|uniref:Mitochondrial import inner membrane translocase subunit TIM50 n=1 Tax=Plasmodium chabaudi adami TaxID=5826 RepID=A0A1D3LEG5_PLACE|nr:mitochondrial import inner membrane translocase subunit TIM50, putative [Plasmodium chabaudi adami]
MNKIINIINLKNNGKRFVRQVNSSPWVGQQSLYCSVGRNIKNFDNPKISKNKVITIDNENVKNKICNLKNYNFYKTPNITKLSRIHAKHFSTDSGGTNIEKSSDSANMNQNEIDKKVVNKCKQGSLENNGKRRQKTTREIYMDRKQREEIIRMYLFLSLILMPFGYIYMYCIEKDINIKQLMQIIMKKCEHLESQYNEIIQEFIDKYFPVSNEPLLPDFKDLNYPENLPTLVIDLNYVIAKLEYNRKTGWRVLKRPYSDLFFKELSSFYEIVIWSDDNFPVAQEVVSKWGIPAIGCLHRDQCSKKKKYYIKDLNRLGRNLDRVVIIDHDIHAFMLQPENGILIKEFHGDVEDNEMLCLIDLLKSFAISSYDIGQFLRKYGGGDYNIGKRYLQQKSDTEQKSQRIRSLGKIFHVDNKKTHPGMSFNL